METLLKLIPVVSWGIDSSSSTFSNLASLGNPSSTPPKTFSLAKAFFNSTTSSSLILPSSTIVTCLSQRGSLISPVPSVRIRLQTLPLLPSFLSNSLVSDVWTILVLRLMCFIPETMSFIFNSLFSVKTRLTPSSLATRWPAPSKETNPESSSCFFLILS